MKKRDISGVQAPSGEKYPEAGGYICGIYDVVEKEEHNLFEIYVDIIEGEFKGFYSKKAKEGKSLPKYALFYEGQYADSNLKGFVTAVNNSNKGANLNEKAIDTAEIMKAKGKKIGMVFREEEYLNNNGTVSSSVKPFVPHSIDAIKEQTFKMPNKKVLEQSKQSSNSFGGNAFSQPQQSQNSFVDMSEDLPFADEEENPFPFN